MHNGLYETSPNEKIKVRTQVSYSLEHTVNRAFRQSFMTWVSVEDDHEIMKPFRRFTGGKILAADISALKEFFNNEADRIIATKREAIKDIEKRFDYDFDPKKLIADPTAVCTMLQQSIDHCESDRKIVNEILSLH